MNTRTTPAFGLTAFLLGLAAGGVGLSGSALAQGTPPIAGQVTQPAVSAHDAKMAWWRDAKFGMFIHWGLYAIPAGEWPGKGNKHAEWIRDTAQIPVGEYEKLLAKFNPVKFNADQWAALAQEAGVRYLVITSKHHDGFCLFDSKYTDWDVMSTPFKRDIMKELSEACKKTFAGGKPGVRFCMYHSIMDWHHPDYLPRRPWEKANRPAEGADFEKFVGYLKNELAEITSPKYDPGLIWFDGEWEGTWTHERGMDLAAYMGKIAPKVIYNNRIDKGRAGMEGETKGEGFLGDYHTPEQTIPAAGLPGDWETCMTMNGNWGYNAADKDFKSTEDLVQKLCDIASKGGNFLLNVGPTAEGEIPPESIQRLKEIGAWMKVNGEAIYGTVRSPLAEQPKWGRVTMKKTAGGATLYLHVFAKPEDGKLALPTLLNSPGKAWMLQAPQSSVIPMLKATKGDDGIVIDISGVGAGATTGTGPVTVYAVEIQGEPDVVTPPTINAGSDIFVGSHEVTITSAMKGVEIRYTGDGKDPTATSSLYRGPVNLTQTMTVSARCFRDGKPAGPVVRRSFTNAPPRASVVLNSGAADKTSPGLSFEAFQGSFDKLPDLDKMKAVKSGTVETPVLSVAPSDDAYALRFTGYIIVPKNAAYTFHLASDDGSRLYIGSTLVVDNDGLHSLAEKSGAIALGSGFHPITIEMFEKSGGAGLELSWSGPGMSKEKVPASAFVHTSAAK